MGGRPQAPARPASGSSFLDDWLQKKETNSFKTPTSPFNNGQPQATAAPSPAPVVQQQQPGMGAPLQPAVDQQMQPQQPPSMPPAQQVASEPASPQTHARAQQINDIVPPVHATPNEGVIHQNNALNSDEETTIQIR